MKEIDSSRDESMKPSNVSAMFFVIAFVSISKTVVVSCWAVVQMRLHPDISSEAVNLSLAEPLYPGKRQPPGRRFLMSQKRV